MLHNIDTMRSGGSVDLEQFRNGTGMWAVDFFNREVFDDLKKMYELQYESNSLDDHDILEEFELDTFELEQLVSFYTNKEGKCIFVFSNTEYYAHFAFVGNDLKVLEVCDKHSDQQMFPKED